MPRIPDDIVEQIIAASDIAEVIGSYIPLKRAGSTFKARCPFHNERTPSFTVTPSRQMFKCFGCGMGGSVIRFVMEYEKTDFPTAARKLAEKANIQIPEGHGEHDAEGADTRRRLLALHLDAADFFHTCLMRTASGEGAREYLKKRGLSADVAKAWKIGFSPDSWDSLFSHAQERGYAMDELERSGLFAKKEETGRLYDRFRGRLMFPICNEREEVIAFSGRVLFAEQSPAKYVNSPETMLFTKGAVLFGLHKSKRALIEKKQAIVCEGQIDLITAFENGVKNVIAPQGTAFTDRQARILKRYCDEVILCFDADAAGDKAAERSLPQLLAEGLLVRCAEMPPGEDPDSLIRKQGGDAFAAIIAASRDFFDFQIQRQAAQPEFATPRGKIAAAHKLADFISLIPEAVAREAVMNNAAIRLEVAPEQLRMLLKKPGERPRSAEDDALDAPRVEPVKLDPAQQWLALLLLRHPVARAWLQAQAWDRVLEDGTPASALLMKIIEGEFRPDDTPSVNTFLTTLTKEEEAGISGILERKLPEEGKLFAEDCWHDLERRELTRRRHTVEIRLRAPGLSPDDQAALCQQAIDLHRQLAALPPPRPPRMG